MRSSGRDEYIFFNTGNDWDDDMLDIRDFFLQSADSISVRPSFWGRRNVEMLFGVFMVGYAGFASWNILKDPRPKRPVSERRVAKTASNSETRSILHGWSPFDRDIVTSIRRIPVPRRSCIGNRP